MSRYGNAALERAADNLRVWAAAMVERAQSGHPGGAMGGAGFISVLFSEFLRFDPDEPGWENRDRFFLDPGHMSPMLYAQLAFLGRYTTAELEQFRQWGSPTAGHPELDVQRGVENTSGPLGQGHAFAAGAAIAERFLRHRFGDWMEHRIFAYISDGGVQEEISQGVGRIAGHLGLRNLVMFYDANDIQLSSKTTDVTSEDTAAKYRAWGWRVLEVDGTSIEQMRGALTEACAERERPVLIIGKTVMGEGAVDAQGHPFVGKHTIHGQPLSKGGADYAKTVTSLGGNADDPFALFPDVAQHYQQVLSDKRQQVRVAREAEAQWRRENPGLAERWQTFHRKAVDLDWSGLTTKEGVATRNSSGEVLAYLANKLDNMIVSSADLSDSDKTDGFLKKSRILTRDDFSGAFLQAGVSELTMAALCSGLALHGGVIPVCATFFVFSDYMKPVVRTAALMGLPVKYVWTHDAFRVGEDGPTHQPVEQEAQIRLLEKLRNHHGQNSMLVLRPADNHETVACWQLALENVASPTGLIFSRQNIETLPPGGEARLKAAEQAKKGAYAVVASEDADVVLLASGSEVSTLVAGAELLRQRDGLKASVVSVPSEGLFRRQSKEYQRGLLPEGKPRFGLTAGLPVTLEGLVGSQGAVFGLPSFGFSAPGGVLDQKLGFTAENVYQQVKKLLG